MTSTGVVYEHVGQWLDAMGATTDGCRTLEVGAGSGQYAQLFRPTQYVSMDVPESWYEPLRYPDVYASADTLPFQNESFDFLFNVAAFDYFPNPKNCLAEFFRVLKPGGACLIFNYDLKTLQQIHKNCLDLAVKTRASVGHHVFDAKLLSSMAREAGLDCKELRLYPSRSLIRDLKLFVRPSNFRNYLLTKGT